MEAYLIVAGAAFAAGVVVTTGYHAREVSVARRLLEAWKQGATAFDREVSAVEDEFRKLLSHA